MKKQYQEEKTCACCGKTMYVLHPSRWAYKKKKGKETYTWYCSWKCMRKDETVERRLTQENYDKAVEIAIRGEDPLAYLKKNGAKNPSATWCYIKKKLATSDPDKLAKVPEKVGTVINEKGQAVPVVRPLKKEEHKKIEKQQKPILAEVADMVPEVETIKTAVDMQSKANVSILSAACKGFIFTNLVGAGILIEKPERGQSLTIEKEEFGILMDALPKVAGIFKGGQ